MNEKNVEALENYISNYTHSFETIRKMIGDFEIYEKQIDLQNLGFKMKDFTDCKHQLFFTGFLTTGLLDLLVILKNLILAKENWERIYGIRLGFLNIVEVINTYHDYTQGLKLKAMKHPELDAELKIVKTELKDFKKQYDYDNVIYPIRNSIGAHIEKDFKIYYQKLAELDFEKASKAIGNFLEVITRMQMLSTKFSNYLSFDIDDKSQLSEAAKELIVRVNNRLNDYKKVVEI